MNDQAIGIIAVPCISILFCVALLAFAFIVAEWICEQIGDCIFRL